MELFKASVEQIVIRYFIMIAAVIVPFVIGLPFLAIVALPIFLTALLGVKIKVGKLKSSTKLSKVSNSNVRVKTNFVKAA